MYASMCAKAAIAALVAVLATPVSAADPTAESWADVILTEMARGRPLPVLSRYHDALDLDAAYAIQRALVDALADTRGIGGYKAGLTTPELRRRYGLEQPVSAVLFADGKHEDGAAIDARDFGRLMLEVEIGFVLRSPIRRRMHSVADLKTYVSHAVPVVELPDVRYVTPARLRGPDIVATNVAASGYVVGEPLPLTDIASVNALEVALYRDGELVGRGKAADAMGDQLNALLWLVNHLHDRGWSLQPGHVLLTGALGEMHAGLPGRYRVDYGGGAELRFTIVTAAASDTTRTPAPQ